MNMKISVITVAYNSADTIEDTIISVLNQSYENLEYIVIDGCSSDGTLNLIKKYEQKFVGRMKWVSGHDNGIYDAMNKGLQMASGDVVGTLNSDDYFTDRDVIKTVAETMADNSIDGVYGDVHFIRSGQPNRCVRYYSSAHFRPQWLRFGFMPAHPSFYVRKSVYERAGYYKTDYKIGSDFEMMVRLFICNGLKAKYIKKDFVTMRTGGVSTKDFKSKLTLISDDVKACKENGVYTNSLLISIKFLYKWLGLLRKK